MPAPAMTSVRAQYEDYPYPPRDPADEAKRLIDPILDRLPRINHFCFGGRQRFDAGFRCLVAGGGTGDSTIYLAEQLRDRDAEVVYVDLSQASQDVARARAAARGLTNIRWHHGSLLDIARIAPGPYDYISCSGVLHHLPDPDAGLAALAGVLAEDGGMGLMVYGEVARTGVYQAQQLLRLVNHDAAGMADELARARAVVSGLPEANWFRRGEALFRDHKVYGDAGLYDLLLHSQDRYTVENVHELLDRAGLHLARFELDLRYRPGTWISDDASLAALQRLPLRKQQAAAELLAGDLITHTFHVGTRPDSVASFDDMGQVPFLLDPQGTRPWARQLAQLMDANPGRALNLDVRDRYRLTIPSSERIAAFLHELDGERSLGALFDGVRARLGDGPSTTDAALGKELRPVLGLLEAVDLLVLAHFEVRAANG